MSTEPQRNNVTYFIKCQIQSDLRNISGASRHTASLLNKIVKMSEGDSRVTNEQQPSSNVCALNLRGSLEAFTNVLGADALFNSAISGSCKV